MAGNRVDEESEESEIVQILKDVSVVREIESKYQNLVIRDIRQDIDFSACFVKGKATKSSLPAQLCNQGVGQSVCISSSLLISLNHFYL